MRNSRSEALRQRNVKPSISHIENYFKNEQGIDNTHPISSKTYEKKNTKKLNELKLEKKIIHI